MSWAKTESLADQYAFQAESRYIDHSHYLLWAEDTLEIISQAHSKPQRFLSLTLISTLSRTQGRRIS